MFHCPIAITILVKHLFLCNIRLSWQTRLYVVYWPVDRTIHDRRNWLEMSIVYTIRLWNSPSAQVVIFLAFKR